MQDSPRLPDIQKDVGTGQAPDPCGNQGHPRGLWCSLPPHPATNPDGATGQGTLRLRVRFSAACRVPQTLLPLETAEKSGLGRLPEGGELLDLPLHEIRKKIVEERRRLITPGLQSVSTSLDSSNLRTLQDYLGSNTWTELPQLRTFQEITLQANPDLQFVTRA